MNQRRRTKLKEFNGESFFSLLKSWPKDMALLALGGNGSDQKLIALDFFELDRCEFMAQELDGEYLQGEGSLNTGYVSCLAYDEGQASRSRFFRITKALIFENDSCFLTEEEGDWSLEQSISLEQLFQFLQRDIGQGVSPKWEPKWSRDQYLSAVASCQEDIRNGRYYQINLLQYYRLLNQREDIDWFKLFKRYSGPLAAWFRIKDLELISLSPERFFKVVAHGQGARVISEPIKGTSPVFDDYEENEKSKGFLLASKKDHAELHMIVDLIRNDLNRISRPLSVRVLDPGSLHSFANVHHLIARIEADLKLGVCIEDILQMMAPGGSITGAPKLEVMKAIREYEGCPRDFYMGNICFFDPKTRYFDSSILIRTIVLSQNGKFQFAAGSGLTINSVAESEWEEIQAKSKVVLDK